MKKREPMKLDIVGDFIYFTLSNKKYITKIHQKGSLGTYLKIHDDKKDQELSWELLFDTAGIQDKEQYQRQVLGYSFNTYGFPSCNSREDVIKLAKAIVDYNNSQLKGYFFLRKRKNIKFNFNL